MVHTQNVLLWPTDVSTRKGGFPHVNKFEQVSSDGHQISLAEGSHVLCLGLDWSQDGSISRRGPEQGEPAQ